MYKSQIIECSFSNSKDAYGRSVTIGSRYEYTRVLFHILHLQGTYTDDFKKELEVDIELKPNKDDLKIIATANKRISAYLYVLVAAYEKEPEEKTVYFLTKNSDVIMRSTEKIKIKDKEKFHYQDCRWKIKQLEDKFKELAMQDLKSNNIKEKQVKSNDITKDFLPDFKNKIENVKERLLHLPLTIVPEEERKIIREEVFFCIDELCQILFNIKDPEE